MLLLYRQCQAIWTTPAGKISRGVPGCDSVKRRRIRGLRPAGTGRVGDCVIQMEILGYARSGFDSDVGAARQLAGVEQSADRSIGFEIHKRSNSINEADLSGPRQSESIRSAMCKGIVASGCVPLDEVAGGVVSPGCVGCGYSLGHDADCAAERLPIGVPPEDSDARGAAIVIV